MAHAGQKFTFCFAGRLSLIIGRFQPQCFDPIGYVCAGADPFADIAVGAKRERRGNGNGGKIRRPLATELRPQSGFVFGLRRAKSFQLRTVVRMNGVQESQAPDLIGVLPGVVPPGRQVLFYLALGVGEPQELRDRPNIGAIAFFLGLEQSSTVSQGNGHLVVICNQMSHFRRPANRNVADDALLKLRCPAFQIFDRFGDIANDDDGDQKRDQTRKQRKADNPKLPDDRLALRFLLAID